MQEGDYRKKSICNRQLVIVIGQTKVSLQCGVPGQSRVSVKSGVFRHTRTRTDQNQNVYTDMIVLTVWNVLTDWKVLQIRVSLEIGVS